MIKIQGSGDGAPRCRRHDRASSGPTILMRSEMLAATADVQLHLIEIDNWGSTNEIFLHIGVDVFFKRERIRVERLNNE